MLISHPFYYNLFYFLFPINVHNGRQFQFYLTTTTLLFNSITEFIDWSSCGVIAYACVG